MTTIATWNLHHMGHEKEIPDEVLSVIEHVNADVIVLTEYVDRGNRGAFKVALQERCGYALPRVSLAGKEPRQNQVLVASLEAQEDGNLEGPKVDEAARTNFLHCRIPTLNLDMVGFRVPHYQSEKPVNPEKLVNYWWEFKRMALGMASQKVVFIGDFNIGVEDVDQPGRKAVASLVSKGFRLVGEQGGLDRALLSPELRLKSFSVMERIEKYRLTGHKGEERLSDHPMLVVDVA